MSFFMVTIVEQFCLNWKLCFSYIVHGHVVFSCDDLVRLYSRFVLCLACVGGVVLVAGVEVCAERGISCIVLIGSMVDSV
jgi:hypothetical protein